MSARPALHTQCIQNHGHGIDLHGADGSVDQQFPAGGEAAEEGRDDFGVRRGDDDERGSTDGLELFADGRGLGVDVVRCAEVHGEGSLGCAAGEGDGAVAHFAGVLDR